MVSLMDMTPPKIAMMMMATMMPRTMMMTGSIAASRRLMSANAAALSNAWFGIVSPKKRARIARPVLAIMTQDLALYFPT